MKKRFFSLFYVHPVTLIIIFFALVLDQFYYLFIHFFLTFIHEMSHCLTAMFFKVKVNEVAFLPIGFYAKIDDLENTSAFKQFLIILNGPLSFIISYLLIKYCFEFNLISFYTKEFALEANLTIMLFNLIPFYPLDGGRLIDIVLSNYLNEKKVRKIRLFLNLVIFVPLGYLCLQSQQYLVLSTIGILLLTQIVTLKKEYYYFLIKRKYKNNYFKETVHDKPVIVRLKNNFYFDGNELLNESKIIDKELKISNSIK